MLEEKRQILADAYAIIVSHMSDRKSELGANLGQLLRRELPVFDFRDFKCFSFKDFLVNWIDALVMLPKWETDGGVDVLWALADHLSPDELDAALEAMRPVGFSAGDASSILSKLVLKNFGSCRDVEVNFSRKLSLIVGRNAAGKTSVLRGINYGSRAVGGRIAAVFRGQREISRLRSAGSTDPVEFGLTESCGSGINLHIWPGESRPSFKIVVSGIPSYTKMCWTQNESKIDDIKEFKPFWPAVMCSFSAAALATPSPQKENPRLGYDGSGLPTVLAYFATSDAERLQKVIAGVKRIVPDIESVRQIPRNQASVGWVSDAQGPPITHYHLEAKIRGHWVPADLLSEGTLLVLGILTLVNQPSAPRLILIDDIDRGLHPTAQKELISLLKAICDEPNGPQMILTTHSPIFLDDADPDSVFVARQTENGTKVKKLTEHVDWPEWKNSMTAGEFWSYKGEDWVL